MHSLIQTSLKSYEVKYYCYYAHFIDEETDDRKFVQGHIASKKQHWHSNIGNLLTLVIGKVVG